MQCFSKWGNQFPWDNIFLSLYFAGSFLWQPHLWNALCNFLLEEDNLWSFKSIISRLSESQTDLGVWGLGLWRPRLVRQRMSQFLFMPAAISHQSRVDTGWGSWSVASRQNPNSVSFIFRVGDDHKGEDCHFRGLRGSRSVRFPVMGVYNTLCHLLLRESTWARPLAAVFSPCWSLL